MKNGSKRELLTALVIQRRAAEVRKIADPDTQWLEEAKLHRSVLDRIAHAHGLSPVQLRSLAREALKTEAS